MKKLCFLTVGLFVLAFSSCKKDTEDIVATQMKLEDNLAKLGIPAVLENSSNPNAQQVVGYYDEVMGISDYFDWFEHPDDVDRDGDNYYWSYGGVSLWEIYSETGTDHIWDLYVKTTETSKLKYLHSEESKDGKTGVMEIYNYLSEENDLIYFYEWSFDNAGNLTMTENYVEGEMVYEIISNVDLSGSAKLYTSGKLFYYFHWNSDGSGSYEYYDENGNVIMSDSWTVADL